jgi:hypothetical protein
MHIVDDYFICLGDCDARFNIARERVYRFGQRIGDPRLMDLGAHGATETSLLDDITRHGDLNRFLLLLFHGSELAARRPPAPPLLGDVWLSHPDMQMMVARDRDGSPQGLFLAAWGGHNAQSHNHNDVGNFILYADGKPVLIDVGRPTYRRQTFSSRRYEIWAFQSGYHNLPTINGFDQQPGRAYAAREVRYHRSDTDARLELDLADAYARGAGVISWKRTMTLARGEGVVVTDDYTLQSASAQLVENLMVAGRVTDAGPGRQVLHDRSESVQLLLEFDAGKLAPEIERIPINDDKLRQIWGERLYRIRLKTIQSRSQDRLELRISKLR